VVAYGTVGNHLKTRFLGPFLGTFLGTLLGPFLDTLLGPFLGTIFGVKIVPKTSFPVLKMVPRKRPQNLTKNGKKYSIYLQYFGGVLRRGPAVAIRLPARRGERTDHFEHPCAMSRARHFFDFDRNRTYRAGHGKINKI
jgi:hypothetical protein